MWTDGTNFYSKQHCDFQIGWVDATPEQVAQYETSLSISQNNYSVLKQISDIEVQQNRATREYITGDELTKHQAAIYLKQYDDQIIALRGQLQ